MRYQPGTPTVGCALPKPKRTKRSSAKAWSKAKIDEDGRPLPDHETLLSSCAEMAEVADLKYIHIPDEVYRLCAVSTNNPDPLAHVLEKSLGYGPAMRVKKAIADAVKGFPDLSVFSPLSDGINLVYQSDVKTGRGKFNFRQRRWKDGAEVEKVSTIKTFEAGLKRLAELAEKARCQLSE